MKCFFISLVCLTSVMALQAQDSYLLITSGGGVTGMSNVYKISPNGKVKKGAGIAEINYSQEGKLKKCKTKRYFKKVKALMKSHPDYDHPGNVYSSLVLNDHSIERKITWGDPEQKLPENIAKLHHQITTALSKVKFKPQPSTEL